MNFVPPAAASTDLNSPVEVRALLAAQLDFSFLDGGPDAPLLGTEHLDADCPPLRDAAVLIPLIARAEGVNVLLTRRPETMTRHAGQVAFPGGRVDEADDGFVAAALREAEEEVGLPRGHVDVCGVLQPYAMRTGFKIMPVVGFIEKPFEVQANPAEVEHVFEVPLSLLMDPQHHHRKEANFQGVVRGYYELPHDTHRIWGVTANMIVALYQRLLGGEI